ncbi:MAG: CRISPR-associated protein Cas4 [Bacillota bacterium]
MSNYSDDLLLLSGIQHFAFCPRQWALIHVEQQWRENLRTYEGRVIHEKADDPFLIESRGDVLISRAMPLLSHQLGLYGVADVVEFHAAGPEEGAALEGRKGFWIPYPVEYKRGEPKPDDRDIVQLCAQAMCLEEMLNVEVPCGDLFYGEIRRRQHVLFDEEVRRRVNELAAEMHRLFDQGITPLPSCKSSCQACSMREICLPKLDNRSRASQYIRNTVDDLEND